MLRKVLLQLGILFTVSVIAGFWFTTFGVPFLVGMITGLLLQFGGFYLFTTILNVYIALKNKKLDTERLKEFSYQGLEVTCPCFKQVKQFVPVRLNTPNYYKCTECNKSISVIIDASTAAVTEPITNTALPALNEELLKTLQNANT